MPFSVPSPVKKKKIKQTKHMVIGVGMDLYVVTAASSIMKKTSRASDAHKFDA